MDDVVGEIELDGVEREIGVRDLFAKDHVSVAVVTGEGGGFIGPDSECPNLELFGGDILVVWLNQSDLVEKPIRPPVFGDILCALGVENASIDRMPVPPFCSGELREVGRSERLFALCIGLHGDLVFVVCFAAQDRRSWPESRPERSGVHLGLDGQLGWDEAGKHRSTFLRPPGCWLVCGVGVFPSRSIDDAEQFPEFVFPDNSFGFDLVNNPLSEVASAS